MRLFNPFSLLNVKATNPTSITSVKMHDTEGKEINCKMVQAEVSGKLIAIIFNDNQYQILSPLTKNIQPISGVKKGHELSIPAGIINFGLLNHRKWKKLTNELPIEPFEVQQLACSLIEKEKNFKIVRFVKWSARSIVNLTSKAYNNKYAASTAKFAIITSLGAGLIYFWKQASACMLHPPTQQPSNQIEENPIIIAIIALRTFFGI